MLVLLADCSLQRKPLVYLLQVWSVVMRRVIFLTFKWSQSRIGQWGFHPVVTNSKLEYCSKSWGVLANTVSLRAPYFVVSLGWMLFNALTPKTWPSTSNLYGPYRQTKLCWCSMMGCDSFFMNLSRSTSGKEYSLFPLESSESKARAKMLRGSPHIKRIARLSVWLTNLT